ncbi:MAG: hypothetical protein KUG77_21140 [Nannocystaceae bacterium]|nr:hypothetical protein [Nannocystaceae bacterium]
MSPSPAPLFRDERVAFYGLEHLFIVVWDNAPELSQMEAMAEYGRVFESTHGPAVLMNIAADGKILAQLAGPKRSEVQGTFSNLGLLVDVAISGALAAAGR